MKIHINYVYDFSPKVKLQIQEAMDWLCKVLESDEFKFKAKEYPERDEYLDLVDGFTVNIDRLYPDTGTNTKYGALYSPDKKTMYFNVRTATKYPKKRLAALFAHEIGHQWFDHDEFDTESFLGFLQYKIKYMNAKSNFYYKLILWLSSIFNK
jgi:hypothetical protein